MRKSKEFYKNKKWLTYQHVTLGKSINSIAKLSGYGSTAIGRWIKDFNITKEQPLYEDRNWLYKHYVELGLSSYKIGEMCGCSDVTIRNWMDKLNVKRSESIPLYQNKEWLYDQYVNNKRSPKEISEDFKCGSMTIGNWIRKHNIKRSYLYDDKEWLIEKYNQGLSMGEIADICECSKSNIFRRFKKFKIETRPSAAELTGEDSPNWRGGRTTLSEKIRDSIKYSEVRTGCFERDGYTCQDCGCVGGELHSDHIRPFAIIIHENNIKDYDQALTCNDLWDANNLRTLCKSCHMNTDTYLMPLKQQKEIFSPKQTSSC